MSGKLWIPRFILITLLFISSRVYSQCEFSFTGRNKVFHFNLASSIRNYPHGVLSEDGYFRFSFCPRFHFLYAWVSLSISNFVHLMKLLCRMLHLVLWFVLDGVKLKCSSMLLHLCCAYTKCNNWITRFYKVEANSSVLWFQVIFYIRLHFVSVFFSVTLIITSVILYLEFLACLCNSSCWM